jgi:hypothetical protein
VRLLPIAWPVLLVFVAVSLLSAGCSQSEFVPVTGTVTWNGAPLSDGEVIFIPEDGRTAPTAGRLKDGKFEFMSKPGKMRVDIQAMRYTGEVHPTKGYKITELYIPAKYNAETVLAGEVTRDGENHFTFELTK